MPTGSGKTVVFSSLYKSLKSRLSGQMLVIAHREELIDQSIDKLRSVNPTLRVDKEMAEHQADPTADIVVASVATLGRKNTKRVEKFDWNNFDKLIVDESHHSCATSYKNVFEIFGSHAEGTHKLLLGVTATPQRSDGRALAEIYESVSYVYGIRQAIEDGWLSDLKGYCVSTDTDISDVKTTGGDFARSELADKVNNPQRNHRIVRSWQELGQARKTIVFAADIQHAKDLALAFNAAGISAKAIWGDDPDRAEKLGGHRAGQFQVLVNVAIALEGYDDPGISCVILAKPTQSSVVLQQAVGRGLRIFEGKQDCIVIDVVDVSKSHSLVTLPTLMGLSASLNLKGASLVSAVKKIEEMQEKYPQADFNDLKSFDKIGDFIKQIDLFNIRFPKEVEENSELTWYRTSGGGYRINVPKDKGAGGGGHVSIYQNMLDQWEIEGSIDGGTFRGTGKKMENAFKVCDEQIRKRAPHVLNILSRTATWHGKKATKPQLKILKQLFPFRQFPDSLTAGQASKIIGERFARKAKQ